MHPTPRSRHWGSRGVAEMYKQVTPLIKARMKRSILAGRRNDGHIFFKNAGMVLMMVPRRVRACLRSESPSRPIGCPGGAAHQSQHARTGMWPAQKVSYAVVDKLVDLARVHPALAAPAKTLDH